MHRNYSTATVMLCAYMLSVIDTCTLQAVLLLLHAALLHEFFCAVMCASTGIDQLLHVFRCAVLCCVGRTHVLCCCCVVLWCVCLCSTAEPLKDLKNCCSTSCAVLC